MSYKFRLPRILVVLFALALLPAMNCSTPDQPFRFEILMEESGNLRPGAPVRSDDETLGRVTGIRNSDDGVVLALELDSKYRGRLSRNADFEIIPGAAGDELVVSGAFGSPAIEDDSRIDARPDWLDNLSRSLQDWEQKTREVLKNADSALQEFARDLSQSPEALDLRDSIQEFGRDLATITRERYRNFIDKELPELETRARKYRDSLIAEGREREAEIFWKWFERWANAMRSAKEPLPAEEEPHRRSGGIGHRSQA